MSVRHRERPNPRNIRRQLMYMYAWLFFAMCLIAGFLDVEEFNGTHLVSIGAGSDPYEVITNAVNLDTMTLIC